MLDEGAADLLGILIGDEAHRHLGAGPGGEHGLGAAPLVAAEDAVDVERRPHGGALLGAPALLAGQGVDVKVTPVLRLVEGKLRQLGALAGADVVLDAAELPPDGAGAPADHDVSTTTKRNLAVLRDFAARERDPHAARTITLRFLRSPVAIIGEDRAEAVVVAVNELVRREDGTVGVGPTGRTEVLPAGLVLSSIGYRGRPLAGLPFDDGRGLVANDGGRVAGHEREYVTGWIKRGPSGIIGTNKKCAHATVQRLLDDLGERAAGGWSAHATAAWLQRRRPDLVTAAQWAAIDAHERALGAPAGRPRVKLTRFGELLAVAHGA